MFRKDLATKEHIMNKEYFSIIQFKGHNVI